MFSGVYTGRRVLVTGHTGFKGAWLARWLLRLGARVGGYALPPPTEPSLFAALDWSRFDHCLGDVRDAAAVAARVESFQPELIFHLAAQSLVRRSHADPVETFATNVLGTVHLLEAVRRAGRPCAVVVVTSDKCYQETGDRRPRTEADPLGGTDPYSASKAGAEIAAAAYGRSFFEPERRVALATARAGNVIGGGDWAEDRLLPDCVRALQAGRPIRVRHPEAVRPWQHVLEPLSGYLWLGVHLWRSVGQGHPGPAGAFNFGPEPDGHQKVSALVEAVLRRWPGRWERVTAPDDLRENECLRLSIDHAVRQLDWRPVWDFSTAVERTVHWYQTLARDGIGGAAELTDADLAAYGQSALQLGRPWAQ